MLGTVSYKCESFIADLYVYITNCLVIVKTFNATIIPFGDEIICMSKKIGTTTLFLTIFHMYIDI